MQAIGENLWILRYPQQLAGVELGRNVTVIRLRTGAVVIHSTAPFLPGDIEAIRRCGVPSALVEASWLHDTFSRAGHAAFFGVPFFAPEGFSRRTGLPAQPLVKFPSAWSEELIVVGLEGLPRVREHVFFHHPSRTLIVADLVFHFGSGTTGWTRFFLRWAAGIREQPGMSRFFRFLIRDAARFGHSLRRVMQWDFERIVVGHGDVIEREAKEKLARALAASGFSHSPAR